MQQKSNNCCGCDTIDRAVTVVRGPVFESNFKKHVFVADYLQKIYVRCQPLVMIETLLCIFTENVLKTCSFQVQDMMNSDMSKEFIWLETFNKSALFHWVKNSSNTALKIITTSAQFHKKRGSDQSKTLKS